MKYTFVWPTELRQPHVMQDLQTVRKLNEIEETFDERFGKMVEGADPKQTSRLRLVKLFKTVRWTVISLRWQQQW